MRISRKKFRTFFEIFVSRPTSRSPDFVNHSYDYRPNWTPPVLLPLIILHNNRIYDIMGPLHDPVTWCKIIYTGEQVAQWDFQNNATRTSSPGPAFVLEVPLRNLLTSIFNFVPCDRIVQRAHCRLWLFHRSPICHIIGARSQGCPIWTFCN